MRRCEASSRQRKSVELPFSAAESCCNGGSLEHMALSRSMNDSLRLNVRSELCVLLGVGSAPVLSLSVPWFMLSGFECSRGIVWRWRVSSIFIMATFSAQCSMLVNCSSSSSSTSPGSLSGDGSIVGPLDMPLAF